MLFGNAMLHREMHGMFSPCKDCKSPQECGTRGHCYIEICQVYNQAKVLGNQLPTLQLCSPFSNFRRDYNMLKEADSDGGECD